MSPRSRVTKAIMAPLRSAGDPRTLLCSLKCCSRSLAAHQHLDGGNGSVDGQLEGYEPMTSPRRRERKAMVIAALLSQQWPLAAALQDQRDDEIGRGGDRRRDGDRQDPGPDDAVGDPPLDVRETARGPDAD